MFIIIIWDTAYNIQIFAGEDGFAKAFASKEAAEEYISQFEISFNYQIVELKGG